MMFHVLERELQAKLYSAGPMRIERVQKGSPGDAISSATLKPGGKPGARIATDDVISTAARVVGIVDPELGVIKNVKGFGAKLKVAAFGDLKMLEHCHVEVQATRIIQEVPPGIPESQPARSHKLRRVTQERAKALRIVAGFGQSPHNVGIRGRDPLDAFRDLYNKAPGPDFLSKISYVDLKTYLVDDVLTKVDRASMANSLEVRVPLLDHHIVEFAYSLPLHMKLRHGNGKYLLRKTMSSLLPPGFLDARKMGFRIPFVPWMRGSLRTWAEDILSHDPKAHPFLNPAGMRQLWEGFQHGRDHLGDLMGILLSFALWSRVSAGTKTPGTAENTLQRMLPESDHHCPSMAQSLP
jgi:hypothetical protein